MKPTYEEIKIATLGNVSAGKSTLIGVLTKNILDNGKGLARKNICKFPHEDDTGKTSSIGHHYITYSKHNTVYKSITLIDLAGHEKYLKTTLSGINGTLCDYVMLIIGANMGVSKMTKEHFNIAKTLNKPIIIIVTKVDIAPKHILDNTLQQIKDILNTEFAGERKPWFIDSDQNAKKSSKIISTVKNIYPIFLVSNVNGNNISNLKLFLENIASPTKWSMYDKNDALFLIEDTFQVPGVGLVVSGVMKEGTISVNDKIWIGPFNNQFKQVLVKSMHGNVRNSIDSITSGYSGTFAIKLLNKKEILRKKHIKKGCVIMANPYCVTTFTAHCTILHHPTTINIGYQPVIHCGNVRQAAKIIKMDRPLTRTGDNTLIHFRFVCSPEYISSGTKIIFREGRTKGIGTVVETFKLD